VFDVSPHTVRVVGKISIPRVLPLLCLLSLQAHLIRLSVAATPSGAAHYVKRQQLYLHICAALFFVSVMCMGLLIAHAWWRYPSPVFVCLAILEVLTAGFTPIFLVMGLVSCGDIAAALRESESELRLLVLQHQ
jgi:hypothetical protein